MRSIPTDLPQGQDRQHRTIIANAVNDLIKVRPPNDATEAETAAGVRIVNFSYPPLNIRRYGGAPGGVDCTPAMDAAEAVCAAQGGGVIVIDAPGEWYMNWVCTTDGVTVRGEGGRAEFDLHCVRPFSLASAPITFGDGTKALRYCRLENLHVSGTDDPGGTHFNDETHSAPETLKLLSTVQFVASRCVFYNGLHTIHIEPSAGFPCTDICFDNCRARNDLDGTGTRVIYAKRLADPGYLTDTNFLRSKFNARSEYFCEVDGSAAAGAVVLFNGGYADCLRNGGFLLKGGSSIRVNQFDLDPGVNGGVIIETDQAQQDPTRFLFGNITHGGQLFQFSGTTLDSGTLQAATSGTATIRAAAAFADNELTDQVLRILTGTGAGQQRQIASNVGATDVLTLVSNWTVTPDSSSTYDIVKTIAMPSEATDYNYRPRLNRAFLGPITYITSTTDPFNTTRWLELESDTVVTLNGVSFSVHTIGRGLRVAEGSSGMQGVATLAAGTVTVNNANITANSRIFLTSQADGGTPGFLRVTARSVGATFTITSSSATDTSTVAYEIFEPG